MREAYKLSGHNPADADSYKLSEAFSHKGAAVEDLVILEEAERHIINALSRNNDQGGQFILACVYQNKAVVCLSLNDMAGCVKANEQCIAIIKQIMVHEKRNKLLGELTVMMAMASMNMVPALIACNDLINAAKNGDQSILLLRQLVEEQGHDKWKHNMAIALNNRAKIHYRMEEYDSSVELSDQSIMIWQPMVEQEGKCLYSNYLAEALATKAMALSSMGDLKQGIKLFDDCINIRKRLIKNDGCDELANGLALAMLNNGMNHNRMGAVNNAIDMYEKCIAIWRSIVENHGRKDMADRLAQAILIKAATVCDKRIYAEAEKLYKEGISILLCLIEQEGRNDLANALAIAYRNMSSLLIKMGKNAEGMNMADKSIEALQRLVDNRL